jgi:hypothetical protein
LFDALPQAERRLAFQWSRQVLFFVGAPSGDLNSNLVPQTLI